MNMIKRFIAFLAVMCLLAFCAACAPHADAPTTAPPAGEITTPTDPDGGSEPDAPDDPNTPTDPTNPIEPTEPSGAGGVPVACFSYSGNTRTVAEYIARYSGGTAAEIVAKQPYTAADVNYNDQSSRCQTERRADARPEIADGTYAGIDPDKYSTVIVGYPIWNGEEPMIVRTLAKKYLLFAIFII